MKRAFSKLKLEHVVIGKGQFHQERMKSNAMVDVEVRYVFLVPLFLLVISGDVVQQLEIGSFFFFPCPLENAYYNDRLHLFCLSH